MISPTYGSVFSCLIIGSILMFYLYLQSKDKNFIFRYGCNIVIISILAVIFRMFLLGSFTFTHSIYIKKFEVPLFDFLRTEIFPYERHKRNRYPRYSEKRKQYKRKNFYYPDIFYLQSMHHRTVSSGYFAAPKKIFC